LTPVAGLIMLAQDRLPHREVAVAKLGLCGGIPSHEFQEHDKQPPSEQRWLL